MAARTIDGVEGLRALVGEHLGYSDWHVVTQEQVNAFADATGDHQWIHVDVEKAKTGPFGGPIAHGYLTLSLAPSLGDEVWTATGVTFAVNYGINKLRFPSPVLVGSKLRVGVEVTAVDDVSGGVQGTFVYTFETEGGDKPACVAEVLYRLYS